MLQTQKADIGLAVTQRAMTDLPLLGRRYSELAFLAPGVAPAPAGISNRGEESGFNANGNFSTWNNYTLDGADNNSFTTNLQERSVQVVQPPVDALEEFRVQTRTYSAEFGRAAGRGDQRVDQAGQQRVSGQRLRVLPRRGAQREPVGEQPGRPGEGRRSARTSSAARWAARSCATRRSSSRRTRPRAPTAS